jgi:hypothetical protein
MSAIHCRANAYCIPLNLGFHEVLKQFYILSGLPYNSFHQYNYFELLKKLEQN